MDNSISNSNKIIDYVSFFEAPLEPYFFSASEKAKLESLRKKFEATGQYLDSIASNPALAESLDRDAAMGKIFSPSQAANTKKILDALEGNGSRTDIKKSLVSTAGQFVILSDVACDALGVMGDGYYSDAEEIDALVGVLGDEGIAQDRIQKIPKALAQYGAIVYQRGSYTALMSFLDDVNTGAYTVKTPVMDDQSQSRHGASINALKGILEASKPAQVIAPRVVAPRANNPALTPAEIKREVSTKELSAPAAQQAPRPMPVRPTEVQRTPPPPPVRPKLNIALSKTPSQGLATIASIQVVEDLKKIEPAHLRQAYVDDQIKAIEAKIISLAKANRMLPIQVASVFEQSSLFRTYLQIGNAIMSATTEQKPDYNQIISTMAANGQEVLTLPEFEAMADLRKSME